MSFKHTVSFGDDGRSSSKKILRTGNELDNWESGPRYHLMELLGKGSYGKVAKALDLREKRHVAVKQMKNIFDEPTDAKRAYREMHILRHLQHPSIVALYDVIATSINARFVDTFLSYHAQTTQQHQEVAKYPIPRKLGDLYLVFEFVDTDLSKIIKSPQYLSLEHVSYILYQLLDGLRYIHATHVIHRDIKPANVLVSCEDCTIKIADFGLSRVVNADLFEKPAHGAAVAVAVAVAVSPTAQSATTSSMSPTTAATTTQPTDDAQMEIERESETMYEDLGVDEYSLKVTSTTGFSPAIASIASVASSVLPPPATLLKPLLSLPGLFSGSAATNSGDADSNWLPPPAPLKRTLTRHVVTRWYRAPEVILLQPYTAAVDVWSVGCIFAELLQLMAENVANYRARRALFPGESCGELSASDDAVRSDGEYIDQLRESYAKHSSQLSVIFDMLGSPTARDLASLDATTASMLRALEQKPGTGLRSRFPNVVPAALDLLTEMLRIDPTQRISAAQALEHPFFNDIKQKGYLSTYQQNNKHLSDNAGKVSLDVALNPVPMNADKEKIGESSENLKVNVVKEVMYYRQRERLSQTA